MIYSSADRDSFMLAERVLQLLWTSENIAQKAVILVGNKADLARSRAVTSEGNLRTDHKLEALCVRLIRVVYGQTCNCMGVGSFYNDNGK